ncbi:helix-turn-helix domain-containing protein [Streptomyces galilaeus]
MQRRGASEVIKHARLLLEGTRMAPSAIASECGFGSVETLHRVFRSRLGTTPGEYRGRFTSVL